MENEETQSKDAVGEMHKRTETMADGKRYIIYYTFGDDNRNGAAGETSATNSNENEVKENV